MRSSSGAARRGTTACGSTTSRRSSSSRSRRRMRSARCGRPSSALALLRPAPSETTGRPDGSRLGLLALELGAQALVEEAGEQEHGADGEERERPRDRVQEREVVDEELRQADAEEREADEPQDAHSAGQADVEEREPERAPEGADAGVPALEVRLQAAGSELGELEDGERQAVHDDDARGPAAPGAPARVLEHAEAGEERRRPGDEGDAADPLRGMGRRVDERGRRRLLEDRPAEGDHEVGERGDLEPLLLELDGEPRQRGRAPGPGEREPAARDEHRLRAGGDDERERPEERAQVAVEPERAGAEHAVGGGEAEEREAEEVDAGGVALDERRHRREPEAERDDAADDGDGVEPLLAPAEELVRVAGEEDARADGEERPGTEPLVEREGVGDAELHQRDAEPGEAHDRDRPRPAVEAGDDDREADERPGRAHGDVAAVEPGLDVAGTELEEREDRERKRVP